MQFPSFSAAAARRLFGTGAMANLVRINSIRYNSRQRMQPELASPHELNYGTADCGALQLENLPCRRICLPVREQPSPHDLSVCMFVCLSGNKASPHDLSVYMFVCLSGNKASPHDLSVCMFVCLPGNKASPHDLS